MKLTTERKRDSEVNSMRTGQAKNKNTFCRLHKERLGTCCHILFEAAVTTVFLISRGILSDKFNNQHILLKVIKSITIMLANAVVTILMWKSDD